MPAKNVYHEAVVEALTADGWVVAADPLHIGFGTPDLFVDLGLVGATLIAERVGRRVAVEIQSFVGKSAVNDLHRAVGQFLVYDAVLTETKADWPLYMAIPQATFEATFTGRFGQLILNRLIRRMVVFDPDSRRVTQWIG